MEDGNISLSISSTEQASRDGDEAECISTNELPTLEALIAARGRKQYVNREGSFVTGFDVSTEEERQKRSERAKRFGVSQHDKEERETEAHKPKSDSYLEKYRRIIDGLPPAVGEFRPEAVFVYGTDNMNTRDLLTYFRIYGPSHLEWIDDSSCNVVWDDMNSAKRSLLAVGREVLCKVSIATDEVTEQQPVQERCQPQDGDNSDGGFGEEQLDYKMEEEQQQSSDGKASKSKTSHGTISPVFGVAQEKAQSSGHHFDMQSESVDGGQDMSFWRLGRQHPKAKFLLLRPARTGDKKVAGAARQSRYYLLHGNPNKPGHPKGLSTKDLRKRKSKRRRRKNGGTVVELMEVEEDSESETEADSLMSEIAASHESKRDSRLGMHADDVEKEVGSIPMDVDMSSQTIPSDLPQDDLRHKLGSVGAQDDLRQKLSTDGVQDDLRLKLSPVGAQDDLRHKMGQVGGQDDLRHKLSVAGVQDDLRQKLSTSGVQDDRQQDIPQNLGPLGAPADLRLKLQRLQQTKAGTGKPMVKASHETSDGSN